MTTQHKAPPEQAQEAREHIALETVPWPRLYRLAKGIGVTARSRQAAADAIVRYLRDGEEPRSPQIREATVIPFPMAARVEFLDRTASYAASIRDPSKFLAQTFRQQETALRRRGLDDATVKAELATLEREVRNRLAQYQEQESEP
jgi:hypothetical protein